MDTTYREICSQYEALQKTISYTEKRRNDILRFFQDKQNRPLLFIGSGSSYSLAQSAELIAKSKLGIEATSLPAGDFMLNFKSYEKIWRNAVIVVISRSGSTSEVLNSIRMLQNEASTPVVSICCTENAQISGSCGLNLELPWAFDESVCQTRSVTNLYAGLVLMLSLLAGDEKTAADIKKAALSGSGFLKENEEKLKAIAEKDWNSVIVLADSEICGLSAEGALAFKEICNTPSAFYHVLDVRHGPIVLADSHTLVLIRVMKTGVDYERSLVQEISQKGSLIVALSDKGCGALEGTALDITVDGDLEPAAAGLRFINVAQMISYYKALQKGLNPDAPHGLDAWIKLA